MVQTRDTISVVICAYTQERWKELAAAIESIKQQKLQPKEIIIVIDHNPELLRQVQEQVTDVTVTENTEKRGLSGARNCGIALATGDIVAFLDDDALAAPDWLMLLSQELATPNVLGAGGAIRPDWVGSRPAWFPEEFDWVVGCTYQGMPQAVQQVRNLIGASMCIRREVFEVVGGFCNEVGRVGTRPVGCEETELCIRAHQHWPQRIFLYQPQACVSHLVPQKRASWRYFYSRCYAEGLSKAVVARLAGSKDGLSSERTYILHTLPRGVLRGIADGCLHRDLWSFLRAGTICSGLFTTALGYLVGTAVQFFAAKSIIKNSVIHEVEIGTSK